MSEPVYIHCRRCVESGESGRRDVLLFEGVLMVLCPIHSVEHGPLLTLNATGLNRYDNDCERCEEEPKP